MIRDWAAELPNVLSDNEDSGEESGPTAAVATTPASTGITGPSPDQIRAKSNASDSSRASTGLSTAAAARTRTSTSDTRKGNRTGDNLPSPAVTARPAALLNPAASVGGKGSLTVHPRTSSNARPKSLLASKPSSVHQRSASAPHPKLSPPSSPAPAPAPAPPSPAGRAGSPISIDGSSPLRGGIRRTPPRFRVKAPEFRTEEVISFNSDGEEEPGFELPNVLSDNEDSGEESGPTAAVATTPASTGITGPSPDQIRAKSNASDSSRAIIEPSTATAARTRTSTSDTGKGNCTGKKLSSPAGMAQPAASLHPAAAAGGKRTSTVHPRTSSNPRPKSLLPSNSSFIRQCSASTPRPKSSPPSSPTPAPAPALPAPAGRQGSPISIDGSSPPRGGIRRTPPRFRVKAPEFRTEEVISFNSDGEEEPGFVQERQRRYWYPLPPNLTEVPRPARTRSATTHAGDAAFWAVFGHKDWFHDWVREVAQEPLEAPPLPRNLRSAGMDLAWAHSAIYTRHVQDACRAVSMQDLMGRTLETSDAGRKVMEDIARIRAELSGGRPRTKTRYPWRYCRLPALPKPALHARPALPDMPKQVLLVKLALDKAVPQPRPAHQI
ncbi:unnamed protein product [Peniophora sp. CBMAI 1063]|nr:unnamed protein product [Peniophora sp. CBMAI 1063]